MSQFIFGIYGYNFAYPAQVRGFSLIPLRDSRKRSGSTELLLTGYGSVRVANEAELPKFAEELLLLAHAMTFCQQQQVVVSRFVHLGDGEDPCGKLPDSLPMLQPRRLQEEIIISDAFAKESRIRFFEMFIAQMKKDGDGSLARAFMRQIEISRLATPYWELEHFLAFTGLEILAKTHGPKQDPRNVTIPITSMLQKLGFRAFTKNGEGRGSIKPIPQTIVQDFAIARNAAFHQGEMVTIRKGRSINACHQLYNLRMLLADSALRLLNFDDGWINWDRWGDRIAFKSPLEMVAQASPSKSKRKGRRRKSESN